ncbi:ABC transporter D family member 2 [Klebsormidium nitens]|uniref:ABC transporter D family member 2 n=1 Tax=Klebsormidium nitens TaxID=105231 RepID=A0A1Y1IJZ1_KLENI|nr:ABC transporter D family member 2 [Klebsormidium nitens]|eukprot:GAQ89719.1 ABC transporter D family member 2 [Klebsormidium nitens]
MAQERLRAPPLCTYIKPISLPRRTLEKRCVVRSQSQSEEASSGSSVATDEQSAKAPATSPVQGLPLPKDPKDDLEGESTPDGKKRKGSDLKTLWRRFTKVAAPYWSSEDKFQARLRLGGVFVLTLATTGISVLFNFLGRDFYNALASKDQSQFVHQLFAYLGAFVVGIPFYVLRDYSRDLLAIRWRTWMTEQYMQRYFSDRTFYNIQSQSLIDNPDQRIVDDLDRFTTSSLSFSLALVNAAIDLVSFSGILYTIYPPLFVVLVVYSLGGTAISVALGKNLVSLNFMQEKREADFRYGLVRVRENAESIAFYGGEKSEIDLLVQRFRQTFENYMQLLVTSRNLDFFTSFYRFLIQLLPAAVVAPLYFAGKIEFGVINQSFSAFNHILGDFSLIVYQFQSLSSFSAVVDRLGEFGDVLDQQLEASPTANNGTAPVVPSRPLIALLDAPLQTPSEDSGTPLLEIEGLTIYTPGYALTLIHDLNLTVAAGDHLLIMGPSGSGKTSLLRAIAGLWRAGEGVIRRHVIQSSPIVGSGHDDRVTSSNGASSIAEAENGSSTNGGVRAPGTERPAVEMDAPTVIGEDGKPVSPSEPVTPSIGFARANDAPGGSSDALDASSDGLGTDPDALGTSSDASKSDSDGLDADDSWGSVMFLPQRPYMVLGTLRQQLLYPTWSQELDEGEENVDPEKELKNWPKLGQSANQALVAKPLSRLTNKPKPTDEELEQVLERVRLGDLRGRAGGLDALLEWSSVLSLGEQQRLAFARVLLSKPSLALMDESTSALDEDNEQHLYSELSNAGVTFVSVGHRPSLLNYHSTVLRIAGAESDTGSGRAWQLKDADAVKAVVKSPDLEALSQAEDQLLTVGDGPQN